MLLEFVVLVISSILYFICETSLCLYYIMGENSHFSHKIYKNNPLLFKSYIGMKVNILTEDNTMISGVVYTVDPVSERLESFVYYLKFSIISLFINNL